MNISNRDEASVNAENVIGLDAYSKDNQFIGRVMDFLPTAEEDSQAFEDFPTDSSDINGRSLGPRHLLINGTGTVVQSKLVVALESLEVDLPGRRVIVPLTIAEIEAMPQHSSFAPESLEPGV